ncbi:GSU2403 family nucleotidyltransferase fold protein, partial [Rhizobium leguminosarum]|uniref:GSU2403 family nucleotidyltransferase fold protein n=1 Tax=Rhizobium leguminosarum TaxID=384 RepID=UPI003F9B44B3
AALANAELFRLRAALVGTVAFQTSSGILGARLPASLLQTSAADFAQFHSLSTAVNDSIPPLGEVLERLDPKFREVP